MDSSKRFAVLAWQGEPAMTINIGEECAHNEIQLLYTKVSFFSFSLQKDEWYMVPAPVKRREEIGILPSWALWFRLLTLLVLYYYTGRKKMHLPQQPEPFLRK